MPNANCAQFAFGIAVITMCVIANRRDRNGKFTDNDPPLNHAVLFVLSETISRALLLWASLAPRVILIPAVALMVICAFSPIPLVFLGMCSEYPNTNEDLVAGANCYVASAIWLGGLRDAALLGRVLFHALM